MAKYLPPLTKEQHELLCECIRYRIADNQAERLRAESKNLSTKFYDEKEKELSELKNLISL